MSKSLEHVLSSHLYALFECGKGMPKIEDPDHIWIHSCCTLTNYLRATARFARWLIAQRHKSRMSETEAIQHIQPYLDSLVARGLAPSTVHTEAAAVCKALGVHMRDYHYPKRITPPTKGRDPERIAAMEADPKFAEIIPFIGAVGIRRAEYLDLLGRDLVYRDSHCYIHVAQGKGGKKQYQLIDDGDVPIVEARFGGLGPDDPVFAPRELRGLNLHHYRRVHGREMYASYVARMEENPNYRQELIEEIKRAFTRGGRAWRRNHDMQILDTPYRVQRNVRQDMLAKGLPTEYDRVALMAVSVFHLSHWRCDVTVQYYMR